MFPRLNLLDAEHGNRPHVEDVGEDSEPVMDGPIPLPQSSGVESIDCCCIQGGLAHCMHVPCKSVTTHWKSCVHCSLEEHIDGGYKEPHNTQPNTLDRFERCSPGHCNLTSLDGAQNSGRWYNDHDRIHWHTLRELWHDNPRNDGSAPASLFVVHGRCIADWCNVLDKNGLDICLEHERDNLADGKLECVGEVLKPGCPSKVGLLKPVWEVEDREPHRSSTNSWLLGLVLVLTLPTGSSSGPANW